MIELYFLTIFRSTHQEKKMSPTTLVLLLLSSAVFHCQGQSQSFDQSLLDDLLSCSIFSVTKAGMAMLGPVNLGIKLADLSYELLRPQVELILDEQNDENNTTRTDDNLWFKFLELENEIQDDIETGIDGSKYADEIRAAYRGVFSSQGCLDTAGKLWNFLDFRLESEWLSPGSLEIYRNFKWKVGSAYGSLHDYYLKVKGRRAQRVEKRRKWIKDKLHGFVH